MQDGSCEPEFVEVAMSVTVKLSPQVLDDVLPERRPC